mmetsp:Transcript_24703/g.51083  ORF Transcript_24703/g.51083 Transcript_24703/m.51083 type:complete len:420 (+) Transcript_24703:1632-2891(+)
MGHRASASSAASPVPSPATTLRTAVVWIVFASLVSSLQHQVSCSVRIRSGAVRQSSRCTALATRRNTDSLPLPSSSSSSSLWMAANNGYGRGADIWPESSNDAVELSHSFPNGIVPYSAIISIEQDDMQSIHQQVRSSTTNDNNDDNKRGGRRSRTKQYIQRILRMAASREELQNEGDEIGSIGKLPIGTGIALLAGGLVRPMDVALVACWTAYFVVLNSTAQSPRDMNTGAPVLPSVPPQGHVPSILSNPMGVRFERSTTYRRWLKLGAVLGLVGPLAWLLVATATTAAAVVDIEAARVVARPVFLLCCQMTTEAIAKRNLICLPLRILVPILYNASRLLYLWSWATSTPTAATATALSRIGWCLGIANAVYWAVNLFAFLIPIASVRYMRAHFFAVEAEEVTTRIGLEETVGLVRNN